ncbi:thioredoxin-disulfide reductase [Anaerococcus degeneri]|uniref:Thioredoxin reductase n=2 Tax=Anaerococcus TaxID=165779 RepID=A0ABS7YYA1_9FIRM|nr:thioredoxin-disulfide reductase [Anaerococcus degeneri]MBP2015092.1 thioredoxin reductase (NADPH) [Anaerococcus degeneri]MCA2095352.1 thioredoxin-disulfide reductase [Anaerococcus degeneri]
MYDIIVIGGGPAGLTAGLYAGRSKLKTLIIEKDVAGGQISGTAFVENYPGSIENPTGMGLSERMEEQAKKYAEVVFENVKEVNLEGEVKTVKTDSNEYQAKVIIISTGAKHRSLDVPGEKEFANRGVSYCATCDGPFYQGLDIYVVGGGDSALEEANYLTRYGKSVTIIHRRDEFRASGVVVDNVKNNPKIKFEYDSVVKEIRGDKEVEELVLENVKTKEEKIIKNEDGSPIGVFVFIGNIAQTEIFEGKIKMENGYIITDEDMKTEIEGVFAVGDTRKKTVRQAVTAASDGCIAAVFANRYLESKSW